MGIEKTRAIVIDSMDWKETSKIVIFLTPSHGKLAAIAKGARRKNSPFTGCLELFTYLNLVYYDRRGSNFQIVSQCSAEEAFQDLREGVVKMAYASYFVQLLNRMVEKKEPDEELFKLLLAVLYRLKENVAPDVVARYFELHLLKILGYNPLLGNCAVCGKKIERNGFVLKFSASSGGVVCSHCGSGLSDYMNVSGGVYSALYHLQGVDIMKLSRLKLSPVLSKELKSTMYYYLGNLTEKRLKSQDFLEEVIESNKEFCRGRIYPTRGFDESNPYNA